MTKQNFMDYVKQYSCKLAYIKKGMKDQIFVGGDLFSINDIDEITKEYSVFFEFYHWTWFESGWKTCSIETFTIKDMKKTFEAVDKIAYNLMKTDYSHFNVKMIKKTWNRFLANLMLEFEEVQKWIN